MGITLRVSAAIWYLELGTLGFRVYRGFYRFLRVPKNCDSNILGSVRLLDDCLPNE